jgi:hypothetical protein
MDGFRLAARVFSGTSGVNVWRSALLGGLVYTLAFSVWLIGGLEPGPVSWDPTGAYQALIWCQGSAVAVLLPAVATARGMLAGMVAPPLLASIPWPLITLFSLASVPDLWRLAQVQATIMIWAGLLGAAWTLLGRRPVLLSARPALHAGALLVALLGLPQLARMTPW